MKKILLAAALFATPAHAQVHYPIITHTGNVTIIDTGIHETFAGVTYDERLYIMGPWQGYNNPMVDSESAEWFPIAAPPPIVPPPPPPPVVPPPPCTDCDPPPPPPCTDCDPPPPPCLDCDPPPPCLTCDPPPVGPGTPEASTWMMMLIGFAGLGYASLRRRRYV